MNTTIRPSFIGFYEKYKLMMHNKKEKKNVYLLGQGWLAKGFIDTIDKNKFKIINISRNKFIYTPQLLQSIKLKENTDITSELIIKKVDEYHNEEILSIDLDKKIIETNNNKYDWNNSYLVCGLGSHIDIGKYWENEFNKIKKMNKSDTINIVGSGVTGTELAFYLNDLGYKIKLIDFLLLDKMYTFVNNETKNKILYLLEQNNIKLVTGRMYNKHVDDGNVIFATGSRSNDLTSKWKITNQLCVENYNDVFAGGDCITQKLPKNAQVAYQQGVYIAKKINGDKNLKDFEYVDNGIALYSGNSHYLVEINNKQYVLPSFIVNMYYEYIKN